MFLVIFLQTLQPLDYMATPLCNESAKDTEKAGKSYESSYSKHCPATTVGVETLESVFGLIIYIHPFVILYPSSRWCPSSFSPLPGPLTALLSFNETLFFMTPEFNLSITGVTALVAEFH